MRRISESNEAVLKRGSLYYNTSLNTAQGFFSSIIHTCKKSWISKNRISLIWQWAQLVTCTLLRITGEDPNFLTKEIWHQSAEQLYCKTCLINGQWGLMGINNLPLILMEINGDWPYREVIKILALEVLVAIAFNGRLLIPINPHCPLINQVLILSWSDLWP